MTNTDRYNFALGFKDKFISRLDKRPDGCWNFKGQHSHGYGKFKGCTASRLAFLVFNGELPEEKLVCHKCDNPSCCNPDHLFLGTQKENMIDAMSKGRCRGMFLSGESNRQSKLTKNQVIEIRSNYVPYKNSARKLAERFGVARETVQDIISGRKWASI